MKKILSEKNIAALLFVMVLVVFSIAQSETKKMGLMTNHVGHSVMKDNHLQFTESSTINSAPTPTTAVFTR